MEKLFELILYVVCVFVVSFSQAYIIHFISKLICKENNSAKKLLLATACFIPVSGIAMLVYFIPNLSFIKSIITIAALILTTYYFYKTTFVKTIIIIGISVIIPFILDILFVFIISVFFKDVIDINTITSNQYTYYLSSICMSSSAIIIIKIIDFFVSRKNNNFYNKNTTNIDYKTILYQAVVIILTLVPTMFLMALNKYNYSILFILINTLQLIVVSIFSFFYIKKRIYFKDTELELENTKLHNKALATINESIRGFKHDMGNMVQSINGYLSVGNIEGVKNYCKNLLQGFNDINLLSILSPKVITDPAIYGVVVSKMLFARDNNLTLSLDVGVDVSNINFPSFELSRIIGILLDNAIEAALESEERKIKLEMYYDDKKKADIIIIGNSVKDVEKLDIIKMFEKDYSTKENPSGFGLYEVLKFLKKNNKGDIIPNIDYDKNFFVQTLTFDK